MAKSKLKVALDNHRGRDIRLEKQRKKEKEARKRKQKSRPAGEDEDIADEEDGGVELADQTEARAVPNGNAKQDKKKGVLKKSAQTEEKSESEWESEADEDEEASDQEDSEVLDKSTIDFSKLEDSDSGSGSDEEEDEDEDAAEEEDIPLSDIESIASEDKGDIIPHQRLTINNTTALTAALNRISLPYSKLAFSEHMCITSDEPTDIPDVEDDLNRELAFYKQSLAAVKDARERLKKEGVPFSRPVDYFAEMVKSDEHMGKIKQKLVDEAAGKKASAEARRQRDLKKFGKQVQVAKLQERAKEKRDTLEKINVLKRKRQGADLGTNEADLFDVELDNAAKPSRSDRRNGSTGGQPNAKRQKKNAKYGFGGKKRHAKSNDAISSADTSGFSHKKMKGKTGGAKQRPGKNRRAKAK